MCNPVEDWSFADRLLDYVKYKYVLTWWKFGPDLGSFYGNKCASLNAVDMYKKVQECFLAKYG